MAPTAPLLTGVERFFPESEIIVSKTDAAGRLTYVNDVFVEVGGYAERELLGQPHSIIRHPGMPRAVFALLWRTIAAGSEMFAYVVNRAKNGDHYWVFAHVTPNFGADGGIAGYHSSRRVPARAAVEAIRPLYDALLAEERRHDDRRRGLAASTAMLEAVLREKGMRYDRFVLSL